MGLLRRVFRRSLEQVEAYGAAWQSHNAAALLAEGPLWVVLGDSAAQGVGASSHLSGYVGVVRRRLEDRDGLPWRVVNLSRSGARTREVVDVQWPAASRLPADLVTAVVGGNDALHTREPAWRRDAVDLCGVLPPGTVVATVARGVFERKTARVNAVLRAEAAARRLRLADLWAHTGPPYRGLYFDGFHPNDAGYLQWADAVWEALDGEPASLGSEDQLAARARRARARSCRCSAT
jgi:lysophospholipase L1-like esterase